MEIDELNSKQVESIIENGSTCSILAERIKFYRRAQRAEETLQEYLREVQCLAKKCEFDTQEELIVRDRLVLGLRNVELQEEVISAGGNPTLLETLRFCETYQGGKWNICILYLCMN